ncbi:hypothetical protein D3C76_1828050 [compost metagenome]
MIADGVIANITVAREVIRNSFDIKQYEPEAIPGLDRILARWNNINATARRQNEIKN